MGRKGLRGRELPARASPCRCCLPSAGTAAALTLGIPASYGFRVTAAIRRNGAHRRLPAINRARHHRRPSRAALSRRSLRLHITLALFLHTRRSSCPMRCASSRRAQHLRSISRRPPCCSARRVQAPFFRVVMPNIRSGILAASCLGFVTSFNQVRFRCSFRPRRAHLRSNLSYMEITYDRRSAAVGAFRLHVHRQSFSPSVS